MFNFTTPEMLANYLKTVASDINKYNSYFESDNNYCGEVLGYKYFCDLCQKLNNPSHIKYYTKSQLVKWWYEGANCQKNLTFHN